MSINLKYIRSGIITALGNSTTIYNKVVPLTNQPTSYILIINQTLQEYERAKGCYEYASQFTLDVVVKAPLNGDNTHILDDICAHIDSSIRNIQVPNYKVKNIELVGTIDNDFNTANNTINRRLMTYDMWINV